MEDLIDDEGDEAWPHWTNHTKDIITHYGILLWEMGLVLAMIVIIGMLPDNVTHPSYGWIAVSLSEAITAIGCLLSRCIHRRQVERNAVKKDRFFTVASIWNVAVAAWLAAISFGLIFI